MTQPIPRSMKAVPPQKKFKRTVLKATHTAHHVANQYFNAPIPSSLNWFFGFGFKLGLLVLLKSSLILFYLFHQLTFYGFLMIIAQVLVGFTLVRVGIIMQLPEMYEKQPSLLHASLSYGVVAFISLFISWLCKCSNFHYFRGAPPKNWFVDFFTGIWSGVKEAGLSILFADRGLWIVLCFIMFGIAYTYLCYKFDHQPAIIRMLKQGKRRLTAHVRHLAP